MVTALIIPIFIVAIVGLTGYLVYRYALYDLLCKRSVKQTLRKYNIKKTPSQIIKEYYDDKGEEITQKDIRNMEKNYRQKEPEQFLSMYDAVRDNIKNKDKE